MPRGPFCPPGFFLDVSFLTVFFGDDAFSESAGFLESVDSSEDLVTDFFSFLRKVLTRRHATVA